MSKGNVYWDGSVTVTYKDIELDVDVTASGTYYYSPGCMYRRNGDPGDPPEEETDIVSIDIEHIFINSMYEDIDIKSWLNAETIKAIENLCQEAIEDGQLEMESCEPDYDDYDDDAYDEDY